MSAEVAPSLCEGRYRLDSVLGEGGMSTVYAAYDERLGVHRALKVLTPALSHHASLRKRFEAEARTTARLRHPNIVTVHDVGTDGSRTFMVLELMTGGSMMSRLEALGPLSPRMASEVIQGVLTALQYAHEKGVVHRDVKPHNILVDQEGTPKLTDFGIARVLTSDQGLTRTGAAIGTPAYMAPEQRGNASQVDGRADIFSAGATLYALVTGREPFDIYAAELQERLFADVPEPLKPIIRRATRYNPVERYPTGNAMLEDLRAIHDSLPDDEEGTPPLGAPIPGLGPALPLHDGKRPSGATFSTGVDVETPEPPSRDLAAFPSLSGLGSGPRRPSIEMAPGAGASRSAWRAYLRPRPLLAMLGGVLATATVTGFGLHWLSGTWVASVPAPVAPPKATSAAVPKEAEPVAPATPDSPPGEEPGEVVPVSAPSTPTEAKTSTEAAATRATTTTARPDSAPSTGGTSATTSKDGVKTSAPKTGSPGVVYFTSRPRAEVFINQRHEGRTKLRVSLDPGTYDLLLESEEGGSHQAELTVRPGQETRYCWDFKAGDACDDARPMPIRIGD